MRGLTILFGNWPLSSYLIAIGRQILGDPAQIRVWKRVRAFFLLILAGKTTHKLETATALSTVHPNNPYHGRKRKSPPQCQPAFGAMHTRFVNPLVIFAWTNQTKWYTLLVNVQTHGIPTCEHTTPFIARVFVLPSNPFSSGSIATPCSK